MPDETAQDGIAAFIESLRDIRDMESLSAASRTGAAIHLQYFEQLVSLALDPAIAMQILMSVTNAVDEWQTQAFPETAESRAARERFADQFLTERGVPERIELFGGSHGDAG